MSVTTQRIANEADYPPLEEVTVDDRAAYASKDKKSLLDAVTKRLDLTTHIGTELHGIQLSQLTDQQKDELALLVAERGVVFFRDQDLDIHEQLDLGRYYGPLHIHHTTPHPEGLPEVHLIYQDENVGVDNSYLPYPSSQDYWHSDVSYELQPPSYTTLKIYAQPEVGSDTLWASQYTAYDKLSPIYKRFVEGLVAVHSGVEQSEDARKNGTHVRREPVVHEHPVVRTHPVTGWKALYVNPVFTRYIKGVSRQESDSILQFLYSHITGSSDFQVRFKWLPNSVAVWDNRVTVHTVARDSFGSYRHGTRVTPHAEKPYFDTESKSRAEEIRKQRKQ
ncbi:taurine catabolism dioxygenase [Basidiobolus meristosporus CBS 931.73]|uniref:Taurine catabolism dioxygenase n=1 Tax=Basidiobolus meristosporus CBS 931.73 TaxID=1314790 RepID=A0A1Y1Z0K3_9FUNG|nr:taurine catabolism dioxygenase [Basidiobolus meristosporus CBS 931.73]|eukprot:ORY03345.1 taurine catabolism dioxygenase [Basidiobolus meristosporus CBS 931.73]